MITGPLLGHTALVGTSTRIEEQIIGKVTIFRTPKSPFWYMQWNEDGHQYKPSTRTQSKKQAVIIAQKKDAELVLGIRSDPKRKAITINNIVESYLSSQKSRTSDASMTIYTRDLNQFRVFCEDNGVRRLEDVTAEKLEAYEEQLRTVGSPRFREYPLKKQQGEKKVLAGPIKPQTLRNKLNSVRQMIKWAVKRNLLTKDPSPGYSLPPKPKSKPDPFNAEELKAILDNAEAPFKDIFDFFRLTGLRNEELCWLMKEDVDLEHRLIHIREKVCPFTGNKWQPKHGNGRVVPLSKEALIIAARAHQSSPGPWLFYAPDTHGKQPGKFRKLRIWTALRQVLKVANIDHGTVHTFRHCFCAYLANNCPQVTPFQVMTFMGHSSLDIVMTYYHAGPQDLVSAMATVDFSKMTSAESKGTSEVSANNVKGGADATKITSL